MTQNATHTRLKTRLAKESFIALAALLALGAAGYFLSTARDAEESNANAMSIQLDAVSTNVRTLQDKHEKAVKYFSLYQEAVDKQQSGALLLSRQTLKDVFDQYQKRYHLSNLRITAAPVKDVGPKYANKTTAMVASEIAVSFETASDVEIFDLVNALSTELPGAVSIIQFTISRLGNISNETLFQISQTGTAAIVRCEMRFLWLGMRNIEVMTAPGAPAPTSAGVEP